MKVIFLSFVMMMMGLTFAKASDFDYTGYYAINVGGSYETFSGDGNLSAGLPTSVGGGNDTNGYADQFNLSVPTNISFINSTVSFTPTNPVPESTTYEYQIFSGSTSNYPGGSLTTPIPLSSSLVTTTNSITITSPVNGASQTFSNSFSVNETLQPGTYWLAVNGSGPVNLSVTQTYTDPPGGANTAQAPGTAHLDILYCVGYFYNVQKAFKHGMRRFFSRT